MPADSNTINLLLQNGNYQEALQILARAGLQNKRDRFLLLQRAQLYVQYRNFARAICDCEALQKYKDVKFPAQIAMAESHLGMFNYSTAKTTLAKLYAQNKKSISINSLIIKLEYETAKYDAVIKRIEHLDILKNYSNIIFYQLNALIASEKYSHAQRLIEAIQPDKYNSALYLFIDVLKRSLTSESAPAQQSGWRPNSKEKQYKLGIITPLGPGHQELLTKCAASIDDAITTDNGKTFAKVEHYVIDDSQGKIGRSKARNRGIELASRDNLDWLFFLDADDLLDRNAFTCVAPYLDSYEFIWGGIYSGPHCGPFHYRLNQVPFINSVDSYVENDPFLTMQMGHFARVSSINARAIRFDESMDCGEDIKFYLAEIENSQFLKIPRPFFYNVRGKHSTGPRSASGANWSEESTQAIAQFKRSRNKV